MGVQMLDLAAEFSAHADVSVLCWPTPGGQRVLEGATELGVTSLGLPHPRDPSFGDAIVAFLEEHPADVFHSHVGTGSNWDGPRAAKRAGVPVTVQTQHLPWLKSGARKRAAYLAEAEGVDQLIAVSDGVRRSFERIGVPGDRIAMVPNGVRPRAGAIGRMAARRRLRLDADRLMVLTIGRLVEMKGQRHLVESLPELVARFPGLAVVILGEGHLGDCLRDLARDLGVDANVFVVGYRADARQLLDAADVFVLPSLQEGMPLAALEAMDVGLPVVGTRIVGTTDVVADGVTGYLVPPREPAALGSALGRLLGDDALRRRFGYAGRRLLLERFTSRRMARHTGEVYETVLRAATGAAR